MFETLVLACLITRECVEIRDDYGPYKTEIECEARAAKIMKDFTQFPATPPVGTFDFRCDKIKGEHT